MTDLTLSVCNGLTILVVKFFFLGEIKSGVPSFHLPPFSFERPISNSSLSNSTDPGFELVTFETIVSDLGMGLVMVPMIAILEQVAIAKAFCNYFLSF